MERAMITYESKYYGVSKLGSDELYHHGILGMKWGVRRYQNADGTWTAAGKKRYGDDGSHGESKREKLKRAASGAYNITKKAASGAYKATKKVATDAAAIKGTYKGAYDKARSEGMSKRDSKKASRKEVEKKHGLTDEQKAKAKKIAKGAAIVGGMALAGYAVYKINQNSANIKRANEILTGGGTKVADEKTLAAALETRGKQLYKQHGKDLNIKHLSDNELEALVRVESGNVKRFEAADATSGWSRGLSDKLDYDHNSTGRLSKFTWHEAQRELENRAKYGNKSTQEISRRSLDNIKKLGMEERYGYTKEFHDRRIRKREGAAAKLRDPVIGNNALASNTDGSKNFSKYSPELQAKAREKMSHLTRYAATHDQTMTPTQLLRQEKSIAKTATNIDRSNHNGGIHKVQSRETTDYAQQLLDKNNKMISEYYKKRKRR